MFCRNCGKELTGTPEICLGCGAKPSAGNSFCQACGAETNPLAEICIKCGAQLTKAGVAGRRWMPTAAGILSIIAGVIAFSCISIIFLHEDPPPEWVAIALTLVLIAIGIVDIVGGIFALKRRIWGLALAGAICSFFSPWSILGIIAVVFLAMSRHEFK